MEIFNAVNEILPNHYAVLYNLGNIYALSGDVESAIDLYTQTIDKNPNAAEAWYNRGLIHFMQNDKVNGCIDMGKAGEQGVKQAYLLIHRFCRR
jgi:tetratricopeptide (TPR) repeat protein